MNVMKKYKQTFKSLIIFPLIVLGLKSPWGSVGSDGTVKTKWGSVGGDGKVQTIWWDDDDDDSDEDYSRFTTPVLHKKLIKPRPGVGNKVPQRFWDIFFNKMMTKLENNEDFTDKEVALLDKYFESRDKKRGIGSDKEIETIIAALVKDGALPAPAPAPAPAKPTRVKDKGANKNHGGCNRWGCFERGGGCSRFGCFKAGGGCDLNGCF